MNLKYSNIDISIIIVNYKSWNHLLNCLESIQKIKFDNLLFEVIIVDNFSNDGKLTGFKEKFQKVIFLENKGNNGFANGCNLGAKNAKGDYLLFLNPDTIVDKDSIVKMLSFIKENPDCGIVSCNQKNTNGTYEKSIRFFPTFKTLFGFFRAINKTSLQKSIKKEKDILYPNWVSGAIVLIGKNWLNKIGGWSEDYWMYYEDVDFSKRVINKGGKVALLTNTEIIHNHGGSSRINIKTASITKTEVLISKHVYLSNHFKGLYHFLFQLLVVLNTILIRVIAACFGIVFFFIPKLRLNVYLLNNIVKYYYQAIKYKTWLSLRSMNHPLKNRDNGY